MAFGTPVVGTVAYSAQNGTSVAPGYPAGILATNQLVMFVGMKPSTANGGTLTAPTGWTIRDSLTGAGGYGTTLGADSGNTNLWVLTKDTVTAGQTGTQSVTIGTNNVSWAFILRVPTDGGTISYGSSDGQDTTAGNVSVTLAANPGLTAGDIAIWAMCIPTDVTTPAQFSAHAITATGATFATPTEINEPDSGTGNDIGGFSAWTTVSTGTASVAPTITATAGGTTTNVRGPLVLLRMRETLAERTGDLDATEGADTFAATGGVLVEGALSVSETGADAFAATGLVGDAAITGSLAASETGSDTFASTGDVIVKGSLVVSETGIDTFSATGDVIVKGSLAATEVGSDTFAATGDVFVKGSLAASEVGSDTFAAAGDVFVSGALVASETGTDTFVGTGGSQTAGIMAASEIGSDTFVSTGDVVVQGTLAVVESADTFSATGSAFTSGSLAASETGSDSFSATGSAFFPTISGSLAASETNDSFAAEGVVPINGALAATEDADSFSAFGGAYVATTGFFAATEAADTFGGYVLPGYVEPGYVFGTSGTVGTTFTITGAQARLLFQIYKLHGLADPLVVGPDTRSAGDIVQSVSESSGSVTISTVSAGDTLSGNVGTMIEELAALHGLTGPLVVSSEGRVAPGITQTFGATGDTTVVTRQ